MINSLYLLLINDLKRVSDVNNFKAFDIHNARSQFSEFNGKLFPLHAQITFQFFLM